MPGPLCTCLLYVKAELGNFISLWPGVGLRDCFLASVLELS